MLIRYAEQDKPIKPAVHRAVMHEARVPGGPPAALRNPQKTGEYG